MRYMLVVIAMVVMMGSAGRMYTDQNIQLQKIDFIKK